MPYLVRQRRSYRWTFPPVRVYLAWMHQAAAELDAGSTHSTFIEAAATPQRRPTAKPDSTSVLPPDRVRRDTVALRNA